MKKHKLLSFFCILLYTFLISSFFYGQEQKESDSLQHEVTVTLKLVQVYVSDKDGNPIQDLTKEDFLLYDNGHLMKVTNFEAHSLAFPQKKSAKDSPLLNRKFFLLLDAYRNDGMGLKKARTMALHFIDTQVQPEDELGLLSYSIGKGLVIHIPLTKDHHKIRKAINTVKLFPGITAANGSQTAMEETLDFTESMKEFAISLRYVPGYKHIILFSAGLPRSLFYSEDPRLRTEHEQMAKELASSSSPIFTVNTQGTRDPVEGREYRGDYTLKQLSALTGGRFFPNIDYQDTVLEDIQNSTGNFYVLGYYVDEVWDGKYHQIKVEVNIKGARVQAQKGYYSPKAFRKFSKVEKRLHLLNLPKNLSPQFGLPKDMPSFSTLWPGPKFSAILFMTEIIPADLEEILADKAELFILVYDSEGVLKAEGKKKVDFSKDPPDRICVYAFYPQPQDKHEFIIVLRNKKTGKTAKAESSVVFPENKDSQAALFHPILFVPGRKSLCLPIKIESIKDKSEVKDLSLGTVAPRLRSPVSPLVFELDKESPVLYAVFGLGEKKKDVLSLEFTSQLISKTTEKTHTLQILKRTDLHTDQNNTLVLELKLIPVPPGEYVLEISVAGNTHLESLVFSRDVFIK